MAISAPVLHIFDSSGGAVHLYVDSSEVALGALLAQEVKNERKKRFELHPCCYASRLLRGAEHRYCMSDLEGLAATWAIRKFRPYLLGRQFSLHTDSQTVAVHFKKLEPDLGKRLRRFFTLIMVYDFKIFLIKSEKNCSDSLSRLPAVPD